MNSPVRLVVQEDQPVVRPIRRPRYGWDEQFRMMAEHGDDRLRHIATVMIAPMTTKGRPYPTRVACRFQGKEGQIVLDQLRTVDKVRLVKRLGRIDEGAQRAVLAVPAEMFAE